MPLKGYFPPLSPTGGSRLVGAPPWHFSGNFTVVDYLADPDAVVAQLPPDFEPSENPGAASIFFAEYQSCSSDMSEIDDPVLSQYEECGIVIQGRHRGESVNFTPFIWTSKDFSVSRGHMQGHWKKLGQIDMTKVYSVGKVTPQLAEGGRFAATLGWAGRRIAEAHVTLKKPADSRSNMQGRKMMTMRLFPSLGDSSRDVLELFHVKNENAEVKDLWEGEATLRFSQDADDDVLAISPVTVQKGFRYSMGWSITGGEVVQEYDFDRL